MKVDSITIVSFALAKDAIVDGIVGSTNIVNYLL